MRMKKIILNLVFAVVALLSLSSCATAAYANTEDGVDIALVIQYGEPFYIGGERYYFYNGWYYRPYIIDNRYYYHRYHVRPSVVYHRPHGYVHHRPGITHRPHVPNSVGRGHGGFGRPSGGFGRSSHGGHRGFGGGRR